MNIVSILGLALGAAWTSGINLYATVAALGLLQHYGLAHLPGGLHVLDNWLIIGVALFLYVVEFVADKIPYVDTVWDAVHTFIRVPAGAVIAFSATAEMHPTVQVLALLLGGGLALSTHGTKATVRAAVIILVIIAVFLLLLAWILPKVVRRLRRMIASARAFFGGQPVATAARR
jgi:hypothetical protein